MVFLVLLILIVLSIAQESSRSIDFTSDHVAREKLNITTLSSSV